MEALNCREHLIVLNNMFLLLPCINSVLALQETHSSDINLGILLSVRARHPSFHYRSSDSWGIGWRAVFANCQWRY